MAHPLFKQTQMAEEPFTLPSVTVLPCWVRPVHRAGVKEHRRNRSVSKGLWAMGEVRRESPSSLAYVLIEPPSPPVLQPCPALSVRGHRLPAVQGSTGVFRTSCSVPRHTYPTCSLQTTPFLGLGWISHVAGSWQYLFVNTLICSQAQSPSHVHPGTLNVHVIQTRFLR